MNFQSHLFVLMHLYPCLLHGLKLVADKDLSRKVSDAFQFGMDFFQTFIGHSISMLTADTSNVESSEVPQLILYHSNSTEFGKVLTADNVESAGWRKDRPFTILTHGYAPFNQFNVDIGSTNLLVMLKNAYFENGMDDNVILVDWREQAASFMYSNAAEATKTVGDYVGHFLVHLYEHELLEPDKTHAIGFSLGAMVVGRAGATFQRATGLKLARVTALDPAGPHFFMDDQDNYEVLDKSDAEFVDVIHSNGGGYGHYYAIGHADIYLNNGREQPQCFISKKLQNEFLSNFFLFRDVAEMFTYLARNLLEMSCSHLSSVFLFKKSICAPMSLNACSCDDYYKFLKGHCNCSDTNIIEIGLKTPTHAKGTYFLESIQSENAADIINLHLNPDEAIQDD